MKKIIASAPGKLMLFGEHSVVYGNPCIVTAVDRRVEVMIEANTADNFYLDAPDVGVIHYCKNKRDLGFTMPIGARFIETLYKNFLELYPQNYGITVSTKTNFSNDYGFGSSSAITVAFAKALASLYEIDLTNAQLFKLCYETVMAVQGSGSGFDLAAAIWGGIIYYVPGKIVERLEIKNLPFTVIYTGNKANTVDLIHVVKKMKEYKPKETQEIFDSITRIVDSAKLALLDEDWNEIAILMNENQNLLRKLNVSTEKIETLVAVLKKNGFIGSKISGAGGGDCLISIHHNPRNNFQNNFKHDIEINGGEIVTVNFNSRGVSIDYAE